MPCPNNRPQNERPSKAKIKMLLKHCSIKKRTLTNIKIGIGDCWNILMASQRVKNAVRKKDVPYIPNAIELKLSAVIPKRADKNKVSDPFQRSAIIVGNKKNKFG
jgi:hypothetical protein